MNRLKKIVLTTDFSPEARMAYPIAARLAETFKAKLCLIHFASENAPAYSGISDADFQKSILQSLKDESRLDMFSGVGISIRRLDRNVSKALPELESEYDHDIMLTAIRRKSGLDHFLLSDTGEEVLSSATRPTIVFAANSSSNPLSIFDRILVPVSCSQGLSELRPTIGFIAEHFKGSFQVVFLEKNEPSKSGLLTRLFGARTGEVENARSVFEEMRNSDLANVESEFIMKYGDPAAVIAEHSSQAGIGLVMVGQRGFRANLTRRIIYAGGTCSVMKVPVNKLDFEQQYGQRESAE